MHTWELLFLPLFLRKLHISTCSSPRKLSYLAFRSTVSNKAQQIPWLSRAGAPTCCKSTQMASNWCAKASLSLNVKKLACRVKRGRLQALWWGCSQEELDSHQLRKLVQKEFCIEHSCSIRVFGNWYACVYGVAGVKVREKVSWWRAAIFVSSKF